MKEIGIMWIILTRNSNNSSLACNDSTARWVSLFKFAKVELSYFVHLLYLRWDFKIFGHEVFRPKFLKFGGGCQLAGSQVLGFFLLSRLLQRILNWVAIQPELSFNPAWIAVQYWANSDPRQAELQHQWTGRAHRKAVKHRKHNVSRSILRFSFVLKIEKKYRFAGLQKQCKNQKSFL